MSNFMIYKIDILLWCIPQYCFSVLAVTAKQSKENANILLIHYYDYVGSSASHFV